MPTSQNGWPANDISLTAVQTIPGTSRAVRLRKGAAGYLLTHFAAWFDKHVEDIEGGIFDDWGYAERPVRGSTTTLSNHASGTAIDLNATRHPLGRRGTFTSAQAAAIRAQLRVYDGALRWGGDYQNRADEMHIEINASPSRVAAVAARLRNQQEDDMPYTEWPKKDREQLVQDVAAALVPAVVDALLTRDLYDDPKRKLTVAKALQKAGDPPAKEKP